MTLAILTTKQGGDGERNLSPDVVQSRHRLFVLSQHALGDLSWTFGIGILWNMGPSGENRFGNSDMPSNMNKEMCQIETVTCMITNSTIRRENSTVPEP